MRKGSGILLPASSGFRLLNKAEDSVRKKYLFRLRIHQNNAIINQLAIRSLNHPREKNLSFTFQPELYSGHLQLVVSMRYEAVIGLEVHAELATQSKMFCSCPVVDPTLSPPNSAVCPVCMGMPGVLPVVNEKAVEQAIRVGLALDCTVANTSLFARKNYFYPDLPKGYQISQFEYPLAENGFLTIPTDNGERKIRVRRAHLEEDTGKLTHVQKDGENYSLVDLNRAGVPLLEIVSEPDMHTAAEAVSYARELRAILMNLGVNSGEMAKGAIRFEANVSVRPVGSDVLNTRVEIKNLNSYRAMERAIEYQIAHQIECLENGIEIEQETLGWDEVRQITFSQRSKEEAHDYRYFPEPDLPPLVVDDTWIEALSKTIPELPRARKLRFEQAYALSGQVAYDLAIDPVTADYFETTLKNVPEISAQTVANWMTGTVFGSLNKSGKTIEQITITPESLAALLTFVEKGEINLNTAKKVFAEMLESGETAESIILKKGLKQITDNTLIRNVVQKTLDAHPVELQAFLEGKDSLANWFFGQVMRGMQGKADPQLVKAELNQRLAELKK
jgi:aspartyl-tRNA(Asn)/glutamyl-tRNA(Gln) amidotransferase subunit B